MTDTEANSVTTIEFPDVGQFKSNVDFHKHKTLHDADSAFAGYRHRPWLKPKGVNKDLRRERDLLLTLLSTQDNYPIDCVDKLINGDIGFRDLASLNGEDLELLGFKLSKQRNELQKLFDELPNQNPSYESICKMPEAKTYNNKILGNATSHLTTMRAALTAANYKLQVMPIEDVVVGDKRYASRFALEALTSVQGLTNELVLNLKQLDDIVKKLEADKKLDKKKPIRGCNGYLFWFSAVAFGIAGAVLIMLWRKKNH